MSSKPNKSALKSLMMFLSTAPGRQKVFRLLQYFCRFLVTRYQQQYEIMISQRDIIKGKEAKVSSLMGASGMARKVLRFGPSIMTIRTVIQNIKALLKGQVKQPILIHILKTLSALFVGMFFICDHYAWLFKMGLLQNEAVRQFMQFWSSMGFFLDCITNIIKNLLLIQSKPQNAQNGLFMLDFSRVLADLVVSYSFVKAGSVNGKVVGLLGTYTSLVGIFNMWK